MRHQTTLYTLFIVTSSSSSSAIFLMRNVSLQMWPRSNEGQSKATTALPWSKEGSADSSCLWSRDETNKGRGFGRGAWQQGSILHIPVRGALCLSIKPPGAFEEEEGDRASNKGISYTVSQWRKRKKRDTISLLLVLSSVKLQILILTHMGKTPHTQIHPFS